MAGNQGLRLYGCLIRVPDLGRAVEFYCGKLNFREDGRRGDLVKLSSSPPIFLERVRPAPAQADDQARAAATLQVHDIAASINRFRTLAIPLVTGRGNPFGAGLADCFRDPFGNTHSLLELAEKETAPWPEPRVYNLGINIPMGAIAGARRLYGNILGFEFGSDHFYPPSLPMIHADGSFAFMIQDKRPWERDIRPRAPIYPNDIGTLLVFNTTDLETYRDYLGKRLTSLRITDIEQFAGGRRMGFIDNSGIPSEIWEITNT